MTKELGKISSVRFGSGGYQDAQFGIWFQFEHDSCGVGDGRGSWHGKPSDGAKWTMEDKLRSQGEIMLYIEEIMRQAKVSNLNDLKGKPVELTYEGQRLKEWRILKEII